MKVIAILLLMTAMAYARSGPYLPSGWKPDGPAFLLPGEDKKPSDDNPLKETLQVEPESESGSEAEGSDLLREYGPPKLSANQVTVQDLPDEATETAFSNLRSNLSEEPSEDKPATDDQKPSSGDEPTAGNEIPAAADETPASGDETPAAVDETPASGDETIALAGENEKPADEISADDKPIEEEQKKSDNLVSKSGDAEPETTEGQPEETSTEAKTDAVTEAKPDETEAKHDETETKPDETEAKPDVSEAKPDETEAKTEITEAIEASSSTEAAPVEGEGKSANIEIENDAENSDVSNVESKYGDVEKDLEKLENEIKEQKDGSEPATETMPQDGASAKSADVPEGFLEYGPPGFREYGPPKEDIKDEKKKSEDEAVESNEARRRRFSPKFSKTNKLQRKH